MATTSPWLAAARQRLWARDSFSFIPDRRFDEPPTTITPGDGPRVAFCGFPSDYSLAFLFALLDLDVCPAAILTSPGAHPAIVGTNAMSQVADHIGLPLLRPWRINDEHARLDLARLDLDAVVMASFDQIVGARALAIPRHGWLNVHPSPLPHYRGPEPIYWTIADGATEAGITLHRAVPRFDAGPIFAQATLTPSPEDTAGTLTRRLCAAGVDLLGDALAALLADAPGVEPDLSQASYRPSVGHRRLETADGAVAAERMVRAGVPNMPAWTELDGRAVYVVRARVAADCSGDGSIGCLRFSDGCLVIEEAMEACGCHHDQPDCPHRDLVEPVA